MACGDGVLVQLQWLSTYIWPERRGLDIKGAIYCIGSMASSRWSMITDADLTESMLIATLRPASGRLPGLGKVGGNFFARSGVCW
jgi:hypothetical protein